MSVELTEEQSATQDAVRSFVRKELVPVARHIDESDEYPADIVKGLASLGVLGMEVAPEWGGTESDSVSGAIVCEEVAWASAAVGNIVSAIRLNTFLMNKFGSEAVKRQWLPSLVRGEKLASFAITEPTAGSDVSSIRTTATRDGNDYVIQGGKVFITLAPVADAFIALCYLDRSKGTHGMATLLVERDRPGVSIGKPERKLGQRGNPVAAVSFDQVRVPCENLLGTESQGFKIMMAGLDVTRIDIAAIALGLSQAALDASRNYALQRVQFNEPIAKFQAIQFILADMATEIEAGKWLTYRAASLRDQGVRYTKEAAMAKVFCTDNCMRHTTNAIQVFGGYGYIKDYDVERFFRDAKLTQIYDGTSEIQKIVIARRVLE